MLILAFDTATRVATSALVSDGELLGERVSRPAALLEDLDELLRQSGAEVGDVSALVAGTGPGSFTGIRIGLATARALSLALGIPVAGISTLDALAAGAPGALPVIDGGRREVFTLAPPAGGLPPVEARLRPPQEPEGTALQPVCLRPEAIELEPGTMCVGDGALRYRPLLEEAGAEVPPDSSELHRPRARFHAALAREFGPADAVEPIYLRLPDADRAAA